MRNVAQRLFDNYQTQAGDLEKKHEGRKHLLQVLPWPKLAEQENTAPTQPYEAWGCTVSGVTCRNRCMCPYFRGSALT